MRTTVLAERMASLLIVGFGVWFLWQATQLRQGPGYAAVGPRVFPTIVGAGLTLSGLALALSGWRSRVLLPATREATDVNTAGGPDGRDGRDGRDGAPIDAAAASASDWPVLVAVAGMLVLYIVLFLPFGFIISSSAFLSGCAWALGSRARVRDLIAGIVLSVSAYVVFTEILGLELPAGPLEAPMRMLQVLATAATAPPRALA